MSNAIEEYKKRKQDLGYAEAWAQKLGQQYRGGGGGRGYVTKAQCVMEIYHQYSDGATNYHDAPEALRFALGEVIKRNARSLIDQALANMRIDAQAFATKAVAEHEQLLKEAGLSPAQPA